MASGLSLSNFPYSNPLPQNSGQSFSGHRPHRNIYGTPDLWQESPYQSYTQYGTLFQVLSHIHHNNVSGISVSHIPVHASIKVLGINLINKDKLDELLEKVNPKQFINPYSPNNLASANELYSILTKENLTFNELEDVETRSKEL